ncbi:MAG: tyrosine-type recombinase/integrase [Lachnospira sp.]|nr:tyrosine-type recombinase/integrase [Lachnospira sp.]MDD6303130.1 tyrosine-type recombinase/integrase [Lachnospiraceae bacterium]
MNKKNITQEQLNILLNTISSSNIKLDDVLQQANDMIKKEVLKQHKYPITYGKGDGRWHTYIPDESKPKKRKSVAKRNKEDLENYLIEFYTKQNETSNQKNTFKELFQIVQENKLLLIKTDEKLISAKNTQLKNSSDYKRYFSDTDFENKPIDTITKKDIENICLMNLQRYDMKKKAFASIRGILKSVFDYAYSEYLIIDNVFLRVNFKQFENMFISAVPIQKRIHSNDEINSFIAELHRRQQNRPMYSSVWAMELQILIGLRRGEIPALTWDKVSENGILICQEQLTTSDNHFVIVNHTKTYKDRLFPLTDDLKDFLARLKQMHDTYYPNSIYLFPNRENTAPITNRAVYLVYRNVCQKLGISKEKGIIKGPHSFRRNVVNSLVKSSGGNIYVASALLGHSPQVAEKNYFTGIDIDTAQAIANQRHLITKE